MSIAGKTIIVTGASSGIGLASARLFAREGANLVLNARREDALDQLVTAIADDGGSAIAVAGDVRTESNANAVVDAALNTFGTLDVAFNNAGVLGAGGDITKMTLNDWNETLAVNLTGGFLGAKYQIPALLKANSGSLIFTSSFVGHSVGMPGMAGYAAAKAGVIGMVQCLAAEYGGQGLRVNAILPGGTDTPMADQFAADDDAKSAVASLHALKRLAAPEEIAHAALFLASDASSFMTGAAMIVDGGNSICKL